jgi:hypothetical protein
MSGYTVPTFDELVEAILDDYALQIEGFDRSVHGDGYVRANVLAALAEGEYGFLQWLSRQVSPRYATDEFLVRWAETFGVTPLVDESQDALRARVLLRTQNTPGGGNATDWQRWALEVDGVAAAWVLPLRRGLGTVDVVPLGATGAKLLDETTRAAVAASLEAHRPITCDLGVLLPLSHSVEVDIELVSRSGFEFDWAGSRVVQAGATTTRLPLDSVADLAVGDRIVVGLEQREIASIAGGAVVVGEAFSAAPAATTVVRPGGPLWQPVADAVQAFFHGLDPLQKLYRNALEAAAAVEGVLSQTVVTPVLDQVLVDDPAAGPPMHVLGALTISEVSP